MTIHTKGPAMNEIAKRLRDKAAERRRDGWELSDAMLPGEMEAAASEIERLSAAVAAEREACADKAREFARCYPEGSDGRNTFILLAEHIERRGKAAE